MVIEGIEGNVGELPKGNAMVTADDKQDETNIIFIDTPKGKCWFDYQGWKNEQEFKYGKPTCKCAIPEARTKCSENGISAYCEKCSKEIKR